VLLKSKDLTKLGFNQKHTILSVFDSYLVLFGSKTLKNTQKPSIIRQTQQKPET